jgi:hypothetical protein
MFNLNAIDTPEMYRLLAGMDVYTGFNVRLDIFPPLEPTELSIMIDKEYDKEFKRAQEYASDPINIETYERLCRFPPSHYSPPPLPPLEEYLEGVNGPPLGKKSEWWDGIVHNIIKTYGTRDYSRPDNGWAYTMIRQNLFFGEGEFSIFPRHSRFCIVRDDIHKRFDYDAKSDLCLKSFVLGMIDLYGNYSPQACAAKMNFAQPTKEEGLAQRDSIMKLSDFFHENNIPFYVTLHNLMNQHTELVYGVQANGNQIKQLQSQ